MSDEWARERRGEAGRETDLLQVTSCLKSLKELGTASTVAEEQASVSRLQLGRVAAARGGTAEGDRGEGRTGEGEDEGRWESGQVLTPRKGCQRRGMPCVRVGVVEGGVIEVSE